MNPDWTFALWGGILIGISVSLMLYWNGRVTGISGIAYGLLKPAYGDVGWRLSFLVGLISGGLTLQLLRPGVFQGSLPTSDWTVGAAGILVGFGTVLGSGCTSGHGVCGISRLSPRSLFATAVFILFGVGTVAALRAAGVIS
ncbi:MAG: YeeE/YedE family protein [Bdellovibrionia bacterium]